MSGTSAMSQVREGMEVKTSDDQTLGIVRWLYFGTEPTGAFEHCEDEACIEVDRGELCGKELRLYIPCRAVAQVWGNSVVLNVDAETACLKGWGREPYWIDSQVYSTL